MISLLTGYAIAIGATAWVLRPLVRRDPKPAPPAECPACGQRPELDPRFCSNCGASLPA